MKFPQLFIPFLLLCAGILFSACSGTEPLQTLDADDIQSKGENCEVLFNSHIDAWNSGDPANLKQIYTDDIVHFDGSPIFTGIGEILSLAQEMFKTFPNWQMQAGETYISQDECMGAWISWDLLGFTSDNPGIEFDLLETRDGRISFWRLFFDQKFFDSFSYPERVDNEFLVQFATSWSSRDPKELIKLYDSEAVVEDTLFGISAVGQEAIGVYASSFYESHPDASWELLYPFTEGDASPQFIQQYPYASQGGVFALTVKDPEGKLCEIHAVVILTPNEDGSITKQKNLYNAESLLVCGWAK